MPRLDIMEQINLKLLADRLAAKPKSNETLSSTWNLPEWEDIVKWWDEMIDEARKLSAKRYRE